MNATPQPCAQHPARVGVKNHTRLVLLRAVSELQDVRAAWTYENSCNIWAIYRIRAQKSHGSSKYFRHITVTVTVTVTGYHGENNSRTCTCGGGSFVVAGRFLLLMSLLIQRPRNLGTKASYFVMNGWDSRPATVRRSFRFLCRQESTKRRTCPYRLTCK